MEKRLVNSTIAAQYCGLSVRSFRAFIKRSNIRCKLDGTRLYDLVALSRAIDRKTGQAPKIEMSKEHILQRELLKERANASIPRRHKRCKEAA